MRFQRVAIIPILSTRVSHDDTGIIIRTHYDAYIIEGLPY